MTKNFQRHKRTQQKTAQQTVKGHRAQLTGGVKTIDEGEVKRAPEQSTINPSEVTQ